MFEPGATVMTLLEAEMIENAGKTFDLNDVSPDDEVVLVTDTAMDQQMWEVVLKAARVRGIKPTVAVMPEPNHAHQEPPESVRQMMLSADVNVLVASKTMLHCHASIECMEERIKMLALEEITPEIITGGGASADYDVVRERANEMRRIFTEGKEIHVTTPAGTDLTASIDGRYGFTGSGEAVEQPGVTLYSASFPNGEGAIAPVEETINGTIVWDVTMNDIGWIEEPIIATVEDGYITEIEGGPQADELRNLLESVDDPDSWGIGEVAVQVNPGAEIEGVIRVDKKVEGYMHIAFGENTDVGGNLDAELHSDGVISEPTLTVDGEVIVDDGELQF